ncbi:MAG: aminoacetone oxidase family FAD-binding enzyme [Candidatus Moraniibacteriota bacterium]
MKYDVVVIGGGPAGMMAAGRAAECGARVLLLEVNVALGKKLLITGGGRSNVTNAEFDQHLFLAKFKDAAKFLFSPLAQFGIQDSLDFFHAHGMPTKVEAEKRVFPESNRAQSVWDALVRYMRTGKVTIKTESEVAGLETADGNISGVWLKNGEVVSGAAYVIATGGKSRPETGSTGEGFDWLRAIGHEVSEPRPSLVPLRIREKWVHQLSGLSFPEAKLTVYQKNEKQEGKRGKILFTHFGLSGPLVLNMSRDISESLQYGEVKLSIDLWPQMNIGELDKEAQALFEGEKNKQVKNSLDGFIPALLIPVVLKLCKIDPEKAVHSVSREERLALVRRLKDFSMTVSGLLGADKAVVTSGGVSLEEVDFKHMRSRKYPNLYLVGDILDIDRPSGGYSLQLCWTTGYVAGSSATERSQNHQ